MFVFTYNDYLDCLSNKKIQRAIYLENKRRKTDKMLRLKENLNIQYEQDKFLDECIQLLLKKEKEVANFINDFFKTSPWKITKDKIKKYSIEYEDRGIIYKYKEKEVYFLIKLQTMPNYHIVYSILNECTNLISMWKKVHLYYKKLPIIVPIVIYIGRENWNKKQNSSIKYTSFESNCIRLSYNFIDLCRCKPAELLKNKSLISNVIILKMSISNEIKKQIIELLKNEEEYFRKGCDMIWF